MCGCNRVLVGVGLGWQEVGESNGKNEEGQKQEVRRRQEDDHLQDSQKVSPFLLFLSS